VVGQLQDFRFIGRSHYAKRFINKPFSKLFIMGRIKTTFIKRKTKGLWNLHKEKITTDFEQNKKLTSVYTSGGSKKLRNVIAGYLTRLKKQEE